METPELSKFLDELMEAAYQAKLFQKEQVQNILQINELIKSKLIQLDDLANENIARSITIENLENENKLLRKKYSVSDADLLKLKNENVINEIEVPDFEEVSNHVPKPKHPKE